MRVADVMTREVISVLSNASVLEAIRLMLQNKISGLPVLDGEGLLVGIITEGDFLRRAEMGTERKRPRWLEFLIGPGKLAKEYVQTHGRKVGEIMTPDPVTITEEMPLSGVVRTMEEHRIKRLPVVRGRRVVGIVSRANLVHALASLAHEVAASSASDMQIRNQILAELEKQTWAPKHFINPIVRNGVVDLWGTIFDDREGEAVKVVAENTAGVTGVHDHLVWVEPVSGMAFVPGEEKPRSIEASAVNNAF